HVMMGAETVQVSTFRAADPDTAEKDEHGRVLRDNVFGTQAEDARRRDFTVNALYYDPATEEVVDFHGGLADLKRRVLRVIGEPETRYREDPVRMLRAVRLAAKLGLTLDSATREPIRRLAPLMERVPPARLFDEMLKLLLSGHASACLRQLRDVGLHKGLMPLLDVILVQPLGDCFVTLALAQTVEIVLVAPPVSPWFRMAYDFFALRAASGEVAAEFEGWWRAFHAADAETRKAMLLPETGPRKRRRRRRRKKQPAAPATAPA